MSSDGTNSNRALAALTWSPTVIGAVALLALVVLVLVLAGAPLATDDLWFHLRMGQTYLEQGLWPTADPMLHTAGARGPVQHEWLFGVAVYGAQQLLGYQGLRALHAAAVAGILALTLSLFRRVAATWLLALAGLALFSVLSWFRLIQLRPDLVSILAMLTIYRLLLEQPAPPSWRRVALALLVMLIWANAHSLFLVGPALLAAASLGSWFRAQLLRTLPVEAGELQLAGQRTRRLALACTLGLAVTLLNPRTYHQHLTFLTSSMQAGVWHVADEWFPFFPFYPFPPHNSVSLHLLTWIVADALLLMLLVVIVVGARRYRRAPDRANLLTIDPVLFFLALASVGAILISFRFLWLGFLPLLFVLRAVSEPLISRSTRSRHLANWVIAATLVALVWAYPSIGGWRLIFSDSPDDPATYLRVAVNRPRYNHRAVAFLSATRVSGNLFNRYANGGYFGYHLAPRLRTFIDGRTEHYSQQVLNDYQVISRGGSDRLGRSFVELLDERRVDFFIGEGGPGHVYVRGPGSLLHLEGLPGWVRVYRSIGVAIYMRMLPRNEANGRRIARYYARLGIPYDPRRGLDVHDVVVRRTDWAVEQRLLPASYPALQRAVRRQRPPQQRYAALGTLARLLYTISDYRGAREACRQALELHGRQVEPYTLLLRSLWRDGKPVEAAALARQLQVQHGSKPQVKRLLGWLHNEQQRYRLLTAKPR